MNYISLGSVSTVFIFALALPSVSWRKIEHRYASTNKSEFEQPVQISILTINITSTVEDNKVADCQNVENVSSTEKKPQNYKEFVIYRLKKIWSEFKMIYSDSFIVKWSLWWALATCGFFQVGNYIQTLWATVQTDIENPDVYNGIVEAANTFLGELLCLVQRYI